MNHSLLTTLVVCCAFGLMLSPWYAQGQTKSTPTPMASPTATPIASPTPTATPTPTLTTAQIDAIVTTTLQSCSSTQSGPSIIPAGNAQAFPTDRIAKTLNGIWQGQILGETNAVSVDYFMIVDTTNGQALIISQRTGTQTVAGPAAGTTPPKLSFLKCIAPNTQAPQVHQFVKVSDSIAAAPSILQTATGLQPPNAQPTLSDLWQALLASGYFNSMPTVKFAGSFYAPLQVGPASSGGPGGVSFQWSGDYRGGGTVLFTGSGVESAQFVGTTGTAGAFLVSSPGNGQPWNVTVTGAATGFAYDKVVLGPLE